MKSLPCKREVDAAGGRRDSDGLCHNRPSYRRRLESLRLAVLGTSL